MFSFTLLFAIFELGFGLDPQIQAKYVSLPRAEFIKYFNEQGFSWTAKRHEHLEHMIFNCRMTEEFDEVPYVNVSIGNVPSHFDAREKWPNCLIISDIHNQGACGSCWAFGATTTASDRLCISTGKVVRLSQQDLSCCPYCLHGGVCDGGFPTNAFDFWSKYGLVSQECRPYNIDELKNNAGCKQQCVNGVDYAGDKQYGGKVYRVPADEETIKAELSTKGSIEGGMSVFSDFQEYGGGIYEHTYGEEKGMHSVRIIGYGVENNVSYWLGANSWGTEWGEGGFFRIKRYQPKIFFEMSLFTVDTRK